MGAATESPEQGEKGPDANLDHLTVRKHPHRKSITVLCQDGFEILNSRALLMRAINYGRCAGVGRATAALQRHFLAHREIPDC